MHVLYSSRNVANTIIIGSQLNVADDTISQIVLDTVSQEGHLVNIYRSSSGPPITPSPVINKHLSEATMSMPKLTIFNARQ